MMTGNLLPVVSGLTLDLARGCLVEDPSHLPLTSTEGMGFQYE